MNFYLQILGTSSALPTLKRYLTSHVLNVHERFFLIDCGEATQMQLIKYKINIQNINHIFISHLHGDHFYGIFGLLSTFSLMSRSKMLHIYAHSQLEKMLINENSPVNLKELGYNISFHTLDENEIQTIYENNLLTVQSFPLEHRIPCCGFIFKEKPNPELNIIKEKITEYNIKVQEILKIKKGENLVLENGQIIENKYLTLPPKQPRSYAFCTDTIYLEKNIPILKEIDLLYHEATYENSLIEMAQTTRHTTALQAGILAQKSNVKKLIVGHFSSRYYNLDTILEEAKTNFENTILAEEGLIIEIPLENKH